MKKSVNTKILGITINLLLLGILVVAIGGYVAMITIERSSESPGLGIPGNDLTWVELTARLVSGLLIGATVVVVSGLKVGLNIILSVLTILLPIMTMG